MTTTQTNRRTSIKRYQLRIVTDDSVQITHISQRNFGKALIGFQRTRKSYGSRLTISPTSISINIAK